MPQATVTLTAAQRAQSCLRAVWLIVSARHSDAIADDVAALGKRLSAAIEASDLHACAQCIEESRAWLATSGGVVLSRLQYVFEEPDL